MITRIENAFFLSTSSTTLLLRINEVGKPVTEYYGPRIEAKHPEAAFTKKEVTMGRSVVYDKDRSDTISLNDIPSDVSTLGKGDHHSPSLLLRSPKGVIFDFDFVSAEIGEPKEMEGYPTPRGAKEELTLLLEDKAMNVQVELHYLVYEEANVIGRYVKIVNNDEGELTIEKAMSSQLVLEDKHFNLVSNYGNWAGEFQAESQPLSHTRIEFGSDTGSAGDYHNPFFYLLAKGASLDHGDAYGFNLVYSGNHLQQIETDSYGKVRVLQGISPLNFRPVLAKGAYFITPMAVLTYSSEGSNGIAHNFHSFIDGHVIPEQFSFVDRPVAYNNWEATYFKFSEHKIRSLIKKAADIGIELFVLDDGWFGHRDTETSSLGDWKIYKKKLPHGVKSLSAYAHKLGMKFGLWFEPEMISVDSELFAAHPEFAVSDGLHKPSEGRFQRILDMTNPAARDYLFDCLKSVIGDASIDYIKWDYNRIFSDLPASGTFCHDFILGLYDLLGRLRKEFPNLLMENCASGGGRNDLGMFSYFAQGWVSDDTDSFERAKMQAAMAIGYPQSVLSNHVSAKTSHQMLRKTSFGTKFDVAAIGVLGYELDIKELDPLDEKEIKAQIAYYKEHRHLFQFGRYDVLQELEDGALIVEVSDGKEAEVSYMNFLQTPHPAIETIRPVHLDASLEYTYAVRPEEIDFRRFGSLINQVTPIHLKEEGKLVNFISRRFGYGIEKFSGEIHGSMLLGGGLKLGRQWAGTGMNENTRIVLDFGGRLYRFMPKAD